MTRRRSTPTVPRPAAPKRTGSRILRTLGWLDFWLMCAVWAILWAIGETWWVGAALTYAPLSLLCVPPAILGLLSLPWDRKAVMLHLIAMGVVAGPIMGFVVPVHRLLERSPQSGPPLRVITCNVQGFGDGFDARLKEILDLKPDLLVLQEASRPFPALEEALPGWQFVAAGNLRVGCRFPVKFIADIHLDEFDRRAALVAEVATPAGPMHVVDVHQMTPRPGLANPSRESIQSGEWGRQVSEWEHKRRREMRSLRRAVDAAVEGRPRIIAGDFNAPSTSPILRRYWGDLQNAFTLAGWGWGYTAPCVEGERWPDHTPWIRIDHILCSSDWRIVDCQVGRSHGADHRLVVADVVLKGAKRDIDAAPPNSVDDETGAPQ
ncbi:endonuclease/exonuclease/phosphatase family protein [Planctellipticum variicoloris]|uniref:endonuclease/exonuclease/phosphatase family protein n=1 Tax=Planctellipticum variicoloris TaxID=3064265 RepID=UPI0030132412|nr:endonuclease/exonuclease/phosphatase family protein [Planctomycetaceae bacterium SH412]